MKNKALIALLFIATVFPSCTGGAKMLQPGDKAPDFTLKDQKGNDVTLSGFEGGKNIVLYFYPKDFTGGCTKEACSFRDSYEVFKGKDTEVIGVSMDSIDSHVKFAGEYKLPFILLSDPDGKAAGAYGVSSQAGVFERVTFVIDKKGIIQLSFASKDAEQHVKEASELLQKLK